MIRRSAMVGGAAVVVLALVAAGCGTKPEEAAKPLVAVKVAKAEESDQELTVQAPATIFPREQASVASRITAPILELGAKKGDRVSRGQMLARLDSRDLTAQRKEIAAMVKDAEASLEKMRSGTVPTDIERAKGQVATTQAALNQAEKIYDRRKQLFDQGAIPNRDLLVSQTEVATARVNYEVAQKTLSLLEKQSAGQDIAISQSRLDQARGRLAVIDTQIAFSELRSPFAGTVTEQLVFPGDMAQPSTPMFTIADLDVAIARAQVPESEASGVHRGEACKFTPSDREGVPFAGKITVVNQAVDAARRTVEVWCEIPNPKGELRSQVFGSVEIVVGQIAKAVTVPVSAVQFEDGTRNGFVMVAGADKKAHKKPVEAGATVGGKVIILKGLEPGASVIVEGAYGLADETAITTAEEAKK
ncbi:MAG: efflux RND transporter periplasmic adaptor subunit [Bryobacteraceae bacterium]